MAVGALAVSTSAIFLDLSGSSPATATFYRCLFAVVFLTPLAVRERRRSGTGPSRRQLGYALVAGALFTGDARGGPSRSVKWAPGSRRSW
jgi:drug/metabolite transporter (DMT)-like permease